MLEIKVNTSLKNEFLYVCSVIFDEWLNIPYRIQYEHNINEIYVSFENKLLIFNADFWTKNEFDLLKSLPKNVCFHELPFTSEKDIVCLFGNDFFEQTENSIRCGVDIFASVFFMLSRWEELTIDQRDNDNRIPAKACMSAKYDFLHRPVVDEWIEFIWNCLKALGFTLERKEHSHNFNLSCDVDNPFDPAIRNFSYLFKSIVGDLFKRKTLKSACERIKNYFLSRLISDNYDPVYSFDWLIELAKRNNLTMTFYFIAENKEVRNGTYSIENKKIIELFKKINQNKHEIGLHGSYQSYNSEKRLFHEQKKINFILEKNAISQQIINSRQHYLRWDSKITPDLLNHIGIEMDSTGGYADLPGYKYGTCKDFSMWSWKKNEKLKLKQRPLIVMDATYMDKEFLNLGNDESLKEKILYFKKLSLKYGNFNLLWHNDRLKSQKEKEILTYIVEN
ncbi:MAG: hypothetical protein HYU67_08835 [Flavobacteriia bacterium]|nr:hypothetical protein [Flavobacteriia bacterium]